MSKKEDLRVVKTKKSVYDALFELLEVKQFEEIKVSEICEKAMVNRSTFYSHFDDKYALLNSMYADLKNDFINKIPSVDKYTSVKEYYLDLIKVFLNHIESGKNIYKSMLVNNRNSIIVDIIYQNLMKEVQAKISIDNNLGIPTEFVSSFYVGALFNASLDWIRNKDYYTKEEIIEYMSKLFI